MALVTWSAAARKDLADIRDYYESRSPQYTRTVLSKLVDAVSTLSTFPRMGRQVHEFNDAAFREVVVERYRVVYLVTGEDDASTVDILAIAHSRQDLARKLARRR